MDDRQPAAGLEVPAGRATSFQAARVRWALVGRAAKLAAESCCIQCAVANEARQLQSADELDQLASLRFGEIRWFAVRMSKQALQARSVGAGDRAPVLSRRIGDLERNDGGPQGTKLADRASEHC
jgi:hypothetical protein